MKIKYFIIVIMLAIICSQHEKLVIRDFKINGDIYALVDNYSENLFLIQLDLLNDSLYNLALNALPQLELFAGPASYHRIMNTNDYERISAEITSDYLILLEEDYNPPDNRIYWTQTLQGNQYYSTSGETSNSCMCINGPDCVVVGYNDSWYNPFDYYGEVTWNFVPPPFDEVVEARVYIAGSQCDDLPLWSETNMSVKNNSCNWGDFQVTLSIDNTVNGPYIIPDNLLDQIWCEGGLQPVVGSEDNYNVDWVQIELYYSCETLSPPSNFEASNEEYCDYVNLSWNAVNEAQQYTLYRDGSIVTYLDSNETQYSDYFSSLNTTHEYCLTSTDDCGESESDCVFGSRKSSPQNTEYVNASDDNPNQISVTWEETVNTSFYNLYRDSFLLSVLQVGNLEYIDTFVEHDIDYEYCVESVNDCGDSEWSCDTGSLASGYIGDVNLDQVIDILDVIIVLNFVLEQDVPTEDEIWLSDINTDSDINILDIVMLVNMILL